MSDFGDDLAELCKNEIREAKGDPGRMADMTERLIHSAAVTIAMSTQGNSEAMSRVLMASESYLTESAAEHGEMVRRIVDRVKGQGG